MSVEKSDAWSLARQAYANAGAVWWALWLGIVAANIVCELAIPKTLQILVAPTPTTAGLQHESQLALALMGLYLFQLTFGLAGTWLLQGNLWKLGAFLRNQLLQKLLTARSADEKYGAASFDTLENDVARAQAILGSVVPQLAVAAATVVGALVVVAAANWLVAVWLTAVVIIAVKGLNFIRRSASSDWEDVGTVRKSLLSFAESVFTGAADIRVNRHGRFVATRVARLMRLQMHAVTKAYTGERLVWPFAIGFFGLCHAVSFLILSWSNAANLGLYAAVFMYIELIRKPIEATVGNFATLQDGLSSLMRLAMHAPVGVVNSLHCDTRSWHLGIDFGERALAYPGSHHPLLCGGTLDLSPGDVLVIHGRTGCGKSTLGRYLAGISMAEGPNVKSGERRLPRVAYFGQREPMFDLSVLDNIALFNNGQQDLSPARYAEALGLPGNLDISALELKRQDERDAVVFLRALVCNADLVILDEPFTSAPAHRILFAATLLRIWSGRRAFVLISHRTEWTPCGLQEYSISGRLIRQIENTAWGRVHANL